MREHDCEWELLCRDIWIAKSFSKLHTLQNETQLYRPTKYGIDMALEIFNGGSHVNAHTNPNRNRNRKPYELLRPSQNCVWGTNLDQHMCLRQRGSTFGWISFGQFWVLIGCIFCKTIAVQYSVYCLGRVGIHVGGSGALNLIWFVTMVGRGDPHSKKTIVNRCEEQSSCKQNKEKYNERIYTKQATATPNETQTTNDMRKSAF